MSGLAKVQRLFVDCLDGRIDPAEVPGFYGMLAPGRGLGPAERVAVYRNSSREARRNALEMIFPVCLAILGRRCFRGLASGYVEDVPSLGGDLNVYGTVFPAFIQRSVEASEELAAFPYLPDLARLEWHWHAVYYAPEASPFETERFARAAQGAGAEAIRFRLSSALRLLSSDFPVREIWRRHRDGGDTGSVEMGDGDRLVIRRDGFSPLVERIESELFRLLSAIEEGHPLGRLAADGIDMVPVPGLIARGWIAWLEAKEA